MFSKREWIEEYKKLISNFKIDERNMFQTHLSEDYHINKIFNSLNSDVDQEKKYVDDAINKIKLSVNDIYSYLKGYQKGKNLEIRQKIIKIEEIINKNRMDFKNKFENLLLQEEELENEIHQFELNYNFINGIVENNQNKNEESKNENEINNNQENIKENKNNPDKINIESYLEFIFSNAFNNNVFDDYSENKIIKLVNKITDLIYIKDKTYIIEVMIDKNLSGFNLGWQPRDHQDFLKLRSSHNNKINSYEFLSDLENILPFLPRSELKNHIRDYNKFLRLNELKKLLISRYKEIKTELDYVEKKKVLENIEKNKNTKINNFMKIPGSGNLPTEEENQERLKKLEEWKLQKELKKREIEEQKYREDMEKREKERILYEEKKKNLQPQIEEYKKFKSFVKQEQENINKITKQVDISESDLERIHEKSNLLLEKKMSITRSKTVQKLRNSENYAKFRIKKLEKLDKIESKLNVQTENFVNKQRKKHDYINNKNVDTMGGNVLGRMTRAVPEWRKGLFV